MAANTTRAVLVVAMITALAGGLRLFGLSEPPEKVFDEVYYASDGCWYAGVDFERCGLDADTERSWVHPPLGKAMIALGVSAFGNRPFGWRIMPALAGTVTVALAGMLTFLLLGHWLWAGLGALLVATEHLLFVQSRVAMLDGFLAMFVLLGFTLLALDRHRRLTGPAVPPPEPAETDEGSLLDITPEAHGLHEPPVEERRGLRPLRLAAGAALGAAAAVKWSAAAALLAAGILALAWERTHARRMGSTRPLRHVLRRQSGGLVLAFFVVPVLVYAAAWTPWFIERGRADLADWSGHHQAMARYHLDLSTVNEDGDPIHPYMSEAWTWPLLKRPVAYHFDSERWGEPDGTASEILAIGNPAVFWGSVLVVPYLFLAWVRKRRWEAGAIAVAVLVQYLPWLAVSRPSFIFYMAPVAPFLAIGLTVALRDLSRVRLGGRRVLAPVAGAIAALSVGLFAFFWPVLTAETIPTAAWRLRMWFGSWV